jgi:hypothetical protein
MTHSPRLNFRRLSGARYMAFMLSVGCLLCWSGCGSKHPPTVPVRGRVTFGGGLWPKPGLLVFLPQGPATDTPRRPGQAPFDVEGRFSANSFSGHEGLLPGTYLVRIECWETPPGLTPTPAPKSYLPPAFLNAPDGNWTLRVEPGSAPIELTYDVPRG